MNEQNLKQSIDNMIRQLYQKASKIFKTTNEKSLIREIVKYMVSGSLYSVYAFLLALSSGLFSTYPLGISLLASSEKKVFFIYFGCISAALSLTDKSKLPYLAVYTAILVLRYSVHKWIYAKESTPVFSEEGSVRSVIALISSLFLGIYFCFTEKFSLFSLGALVYSSFVCIVLTAIFSGYTQSAHPLHRQASLCALGFALVQALSGYSILSFSLGFAACTALSVYAALTGEMFFATIFSLICGFACRHPDLAPMFAIIALTVSLISGFRRRSAIPAGIAAGTAYGFWVQGLSALTYVLPDIMVGSLIAAIIKKITTVSREDDEKARSGSLPLDMQTIINREAKEDAQNMSMSLASLSSVLNEISEKLKRPDISALEEIAEEVYSGRCECCKIKSLCSIGFAQLGEKERQSFLYDTSSSLFDKGYIEASDLPIKLRERCRDTKNIIFHLNEGYGSLLKRLSAEDKTRAFSIGYSSVARLIEEGEARREEELRIDEGLSDSAAGLAKELGLDCHQAYVYGKRKKAVVLKGKGNLSISATRLKESFSTLCKMKMSTPYINNSEERWQITMEGKPVLLCNMGFARKSKAGETVCGDSVVNFDTKDGYYYSVLSDGMGSGRQAAMVSGICCTFAEKLSMCGGSLKTVLETINNFILNQSYECSATLDLLRIDSFSAEACFVKSGAVTSLVIRGGHVFRVSSATVPIGVMRELNCEQINLTLKGGDIVILTSDGVMPDFEKGLFVLDTALKNTNLTPEELAEKIITTASEKLRNKDDMSCAVIKVQTA